MPRRKTKYQPDRKVRVLREYRGADSEFAWEVVSTVYAMRQDKAGSSSERDGVERYSKTVIFITPKTLRRNMPADAGGSDALGARELGQVPAGGRSAPTAPRQTVRGAQVSPGDAIQDLGTHGHPIFEVTDVHELGDRRRVQLFCQRTDVTGTVYGGD